MSDAWQREVDELHEFFEAYFLGTIDDPERVQVALADDFEIVGPDGSVSDRAATMAAIIGGHAHTSSLVINTINHRLLIDAGNLIIGEYVEEHELSERTNRRLSTVVMSPDPSAPNGLVWRRVHETWLAS